MRGWPCESHWIGCGTVGTPHGERVVAVIAHREEPAVTGFPEGSSWAERLCVLTGWEPVPRPAVDWRAAEAELGTPLPRDYKEIVDLFGTGTFDDYVDLLVPGARGMDIVVWAGLGGDGTDLYEPTPPTRRRGACCGGDPRSRSSTSSGRPGRPIRTTGPSSAGSTATGGDSTAVWASSSSACSRTCGTDSPRATSERTTSRATTCDPPGRGPAPAPRTGPDR